MEILELLVLLSNDLLILKLEKLALFFKISDNLAQRLLQQLNLRLQKLDLLVFLELFLCVLLH